MALKIPPPVLFLISAILMKFSPNVGIFTQNWSVILPFIAFGILLDGASLQRFHQAKTTINPLTLEKTSQLVTTGIYRFSRNPMYLSLVCYLIAWGAWLGNGLAFLWIAPFIAVVTTLQILPEEKTLEKNSGRLIFTTKAEHVVGFDF